MQLNLGIISKNGEIINHRSLLKVCFNPLLKLVGLEIASVFDKGKLIRIVLHRCPRRPLIWSWKYDATECEIERKRIWL